MPGREEFKREYLESIAETCSKPFAECSRMERYTALAAMIRECCSGVRAETLRRRAAARGYCNIARAKAHARCAFGIPCIVTDKLIPIGIIEYAV